MRPTRMRRVVTTIDGQMGWAKQAARGTTRFGLARIRMAGHAWAAAAARGPARARPVQVDGTIWPIISFLTL
jgi:hypothetical protein